MIKVFVTPSCSSSNKAKKWFKLHHIPFQEINLLTRQLQIFEIKEILQYTENGFEDIISKKSDYFRNNPLDFETMSFNDLSEIIINNPRILKRPLILGPNSLQIGFNDEDIREFIPKELRERVICEDCDVFNNPCEYLNLLKNYFEEIKAELKNKQA
ncbi:MAG: Spx/MgsR family RNA polymerase-binding regulatory protein [Erysipelotrichales bacterium]|nr:Spx/MgsR family RNA polymerase-binding regulatory protein [Erysipelotrichales bacterium]